MIEEIRMPPAPEGTVVLAQWHVPAVVVGPGTAICELETEHANVDLPTGFAGRIEQVAPAGAPLRPGDLICRIHTNP